jgi:hypothetical protein
MRLPTPDVVSDCKPARVLDDRAGFYNARDLMRVDLFDFDLPMTILIALCDTRSRDASWLIVHGRGRFLGPWRLRPAVLSQTRRRSGGTGTGYSVRRRSP